jgi:hypothetical protein
VGILEVNGNLTLFVWECGLPVGLEDVAGDEQALACGGPDSTVDVVVDRQGRFVIFKLLDGSNLYFNSSSGAGGMS